MEGNDERVDDFNGQGNDQGMGAKRGAEGVIGNVEGDNRGAPDFSTIIAQQLQNLLPAMLSQVSNRENVGNQNGNMVNENVQENIRNVIVNGNRVGFSYKEFLACNHKEYDGKGGNVVLTRWIEKMESVHDMSGCSIDQKVKYTVGSFVEFYPSLEMQKLESELWNHAMVRAGHAAYTDRFHKLARLVPHLVTPESRMIERYVYSLAPQIRGMVTATEPKTIQKVVLIYDALTNEAVRNGSIKKVEKRGDVGEPSKDKNGRDNNKRTRTGNAFVTTVNPVGRENTGTWPKAHEPRENRLNQVAANNGGQGRRNQRNHARGRAFILGAEEARQDPNIVTGLEPSELGFKYEIEIASRQLAEIDKVIKGYKLEIKGHVFDIDLIPFGHGSFDVIIGMDWLSNYKAEIVCHEKAVMIPLPDGKKQEEIIVVRDFPEVFPDDLSGLPPIREIEFRTELTPGATPVAKSPYHLAPSELEDLLGQLKELQDKGFIRPSSLPWGAPILIDDLFDQLQGSQFFLKIDLSDTLVRLKALRIERATRTPTELRSYLKIMAGIIVEYDEGQMIGPSLVQRLLKRSTQIKDRLKCCSVKSSEKVMLKGGSPLATLVYSVIMILHRNVSPWHKVENFQKRSFKKMKRIGIAIVNGLVKADAPSRKERDKICAYDCYVNICDVILLACTVFGMERVLVLLACTMFGMARVLVLLASIVVGMARVVVLLACTVFGMQGLWSCPNISAPAGEVKEENLDPEIVEGLIHFLDAHNELVQLFRTTRDKCREMDIPEFKIRLYSGEGARVRSDFQRRKDFPAICGWCFLFCRTKLARLHKKNQNDIRSDYLSGLYDAISRGERDGYEVGGRIILPTIHVCLLSRLAICRNLGNPQFFITFTCNVNWPEIRRYMAQYPQLMTSDRAYIVCRVFEQKIHAVVTFLKKEQTFGNVTGVLYTFEFQKRGLPHCHTLL
ncbi:putative reverse transcriptase domain-containing protein [Tanacetum coccineum]